MAAGSHARPARLRPVQVAALVVASIFAVIGVLGFVPGVTTRYDSLATTGSESGALLLGVFQVSVLGGRPEYAGNRQQAHRGSVAERPTSVERVRFR